MMKTVLIVGLVILLVALPVWGKDSKKKETREKTVSIVKFIPGLYQVSSGKYFKGVLLLGTFVGAVTGTVVYNSKGNDSYRQYQQSTNVEDIVLFRQQTQDSFKKRNLFIAGIFSVFVLHIIDLKFSKSGKTGVKGDIRKDRIDIGFYYSF
jgi:hypothetical protein